MSSPVPLAVRQALTLHQAAPYVSGAYLAFFAVVVIYVAIMALKQRRLHRQLSELVKEALERADGAAPSGEPNDAERAAPPLSTRR